MMKKICLVLFILGFAKFLSAQHNFSAWVKDSVSGEALSNVSVMVKGTKLGQATDSSGRISFSSLPAGKHFFIFSQAGYSTKTIEIDLSFSTTDTTIIVFLSKLEVSLNEVIISSSRTESGIENTPTRVEVLGAEEVDEEVSLKPNNIASLLGDIAGIQTQVTSAATGNTEMRVQGLPGKYTQLLRDGMPLFGGYSGSFSILQIPPLDLKQIEIIKGSVSTLYGGGAIAGMINLISKKPRPGVFEKTILLNQTTLKETNANFYLSNRKQKFGYTFFTGLNHQIQVDVNKDGFSDVPGIDGYFLHPVIFIYPSDRSSISVGYNGVFENRKGGDMQVLKNNSSAQHQYFDKDESRRHTLDINIDNKIRSADKLIFKSTASWLDRKIETNLFGMKARQISYYSELSYLRKAKNNDLVAGINLNGEDFKRAKPDSSLLKDYVYNTLGIFLQDDWRIKSKLTFESGLRFDHQNIYGNFLLPRFSFLYRINTDITTRFGGGLGYAIPTPFNSDIDERDYKKLNPPSGLKAERSAGLNWDINYRKNLNGWELTFNQTFFLTKINHPVIASLSSNAVINFYNAVKPISTTGFETYIQLHHDKLEIYLGYVFTSAKKLYDNVHPYLSLSAKNKFATVLAYEFSDHFRAGIESAFTGRQWLDDGTRTPAYPFVAAMMRYDYKNFAFVLNCENLFDYRQTKKENIIIPPFSNPEFKQLWAPIDGRIVNLSVRIKIE